MKTFAKVITAFMLILIFQINVLAAEKEDYYDSQLKASGIEALYSNLDSQTKDVLSSLGLNGSDYNSLFDISPQKVFSFIKLLADGRWEETLMAVVRVEGIILMLSAGETFITEDRKMKNVLNTAGVLLMTVALGTPVFEAISSAVSSVGMCCTFMKSLIPVLAGAVIASGNPMTALSFQSWAFAAAQLISSLCQTYIVPAVGAIAALNISASIMPEYQFSEVTKFIKKTIISLLSLTATLYVSFLGINGALSSSADGVASKGIKLIISSAVPVVGGAISEAYSGIIGSLSLVKSTLGVFGIISVAAITLPSLFQLLFWIFALKFCSATGAVFRQQTTSEFLAGLSSALTLMNVVLVFNGVLFIISMALIINLN